MQEGVSNTTTAAAAAAANMGGVYLKLEGDSRVSVDERVDAGSGLHSAFGDALVFDILQIILQRS